VETGRQVRLGGGALWALLRPTEPVLDPVVQVGEEGRDGLLPVPGWWRRDVATLKVRER